MRPLLEALNAISQAYNRLVQMLFLILEDV